MHIELNKYIINLFSELEETNAQPAAKRLPSGKGYLCADYCAVKCVNWQRSAKMY